ncbi:hypothetical protein DPMN_049447 [Dreissena polymorpha]|uniref:Uncharacterized protein n=1 Tax=Dreissena polymorpha TaxID=45954 RepID=A0A9D4CFL2_DREPO|nr:hypothetical protein DPMN_049447 [Dreissena polymorpha]
MHDVSRVKTDFQCIANFPNVVGVVDGTQVQMCRMHMSIEWDIILSIPRADIITRSKVERGIGQLKRRWGVLHGEIRLKPEKACHSSANDITSSWSLS